MRSDCLFILLVGLLIGILSHTARARTLIEGRESGEAALAEHSLQAETPSGTYTQSPFSIRATKLRFDWKLSTPATEMIEARWIAENAVGAPKNYVIASAKSEPGMSSGQFSLTSPTNGFPAGFYRLEIWRLGKLLHSEEFRMLTSARVRLVVGGDADLTDKLKSCLATGLRGLPAMEVVDETPHYALNVVALKYQAPDEHSQNVISFVFLGVESEWFREPAKGNPLLEIILSNGLYSLGHNDHDVIFGPSRTLEKQCQDVVQRFYTDHIEAGRKVMLGPEEFYDSILPNQ